MLTARLRACFLALCLSVLLIVACSQGGSRLAPDDFSDDAVAAGADGPSDVAVESHARATRRDRSEEAAPPEAPSEAAPEEASSEDTAVAPLGEVAPPGEDDAAGELAAGAGQAVAPDEVVAEGLFVDAMVGQINGKPVYASSVLGAIGEDVLDQIGRNNSRFAFREQAERLIGSEIERRVVDALILAEAEKDLDEEQHHQLLAYMEKEREKILAQHLGSQALAEQALQKELGHGLDRELELRRQRALIDRYRFEKLRPQIVVTRRDVERYYRDNYDEYNEAPSVEVEVVFVSDAATADQVEAALESGVAFEDLDQRVSSITADGEVDQFSALRWEPLNDAVRKLEVGEHTPRVEVEGGYAWARLADVKGGASQSIKEVFLDIERRLQAAQSNELWRRHINNLLQRGNFTPLDEMTRALLEVAMSRHAASG